MVELPDKLWAGASSVVFVHGLVQNMGLSLPPASSGHPNYRLEILASNSDDLETATLTDISGLWDFPERSNEDAIAAGELHRLDGVRVGY